MQRQDTRDECQVAGGGEGQVQPAGEYPPKSPIFTPTRSLLQQQSVSLHALLHSSFSQPSPATELQSGKECVTEAKRGYWGKGGADLVWLKFIKAVSKSGAKNPLGCSKKDPRALETLQAELERGREEAESQGHQLVKLEQNFKDRSAAWQAAKDRVASLQQVLPLSWLPLPVTLAWWLIPSVSPSPDPIQWPGSIHSSQGGEDG